MILKAENITHIYSPKTPFEKKALDDVSFSIEKGEFVGLIGHTGSGKSTLAQMLNGLLRPSSGKIYLDGEDIWAKPKEIRKVRFAVGVVFQYPEYQLFGETVYADMALGPRNMGLSEQEIKERIEEAADFVGLTNEQLKRSPFELSGGQKRRAAIGSIVAMRPKVLVLDEPTAGLDPYGRERLLRRIRQYHESGDKTVILISHSMEEIAENASRILVMNHGKLELCDKTSDVFRHAQRLSDIGLSIPHITRVMLALKEKGVDVRTDIFTVEDAKAELLRVMRGADIV
ncbi:MAG: energy-coupling factor transporter ATPase [Ruminococcaceae bacterium]|nr:energy-coupling factor transporter ATPase [Oscillospiraceae bacterium]